MSRATSPESFPEDARTNRPPWTIFYVALAVRLAVILIGRTYRTPPEWNHFNFAFEIGRIAQSLAEGKGFANPFGGNTGPTAWIMPLYPLLLAAIFKVAGAYTALSAFLIHSIDSIFAAFTAVVVAQIGYRLFGRRVGLWAGWIWALYPGTIQYPIHWIWDTTLSALCFSLMLLQALRMRGIGDGRTRLATLDWAVLGLTWAFIGMVNPTTFLLLPIVFLWIAIIPKSRFITQLKAIGTQTRRALVAGLVILLVFSPWVYRNWIEFHVFIPTRGNLGAELEAAWSPLWEGFPAQGQRVGILDADPTHRHYQQVGEVAYVREQNEKAHLWLRKDPWRVLIHDPLLRLEMFWAGVPHPEDRHPVLEIFREVNYAFLSVAGLLGVGLALTRRVPGAALFFWACVVMPLTYYLTTTAARFRHPLEVILIIGASYAFSQAEPRLGLSKRSWLLPSR